ncbi:hypothetical protein GCM10010340_67830 [Streptomyces griseoloalbus]|nr:hypothetical protein GCM10010340_67830 [Streptomyces albaduncus]
MVPKKRMGSGRGPTGVPGVAGEPAVLSGVPFSALTRRLWLRAYRGLRVGSGSARGAGPEPRTGDVPYGRVPVVPAAGQRQREAT